MFSNKRNINILTAALKLYDLNDVVVCPGSRNAPIVHNLHEASYRLYPVTDERSASFVALGMWLARKKPIAVCVTSGSALLNALPGMVEAYYRNAPIMLISADRPAKWIGQLDGQTIVQQGALRPYCETYQLDEDTLNPEEIIARACRALTSPCGPSHLNIALSEPLFHFTEHQLPEITVSVEREECQKPSIPKGVAQLLVNATLPALVIGQFDEVPLPAVEKLYREHKLLILPDINSNQAPTSNAYLYEVMKGDGRLPSPDVVVHIGGAFVGKELKLFLRQSDGLKVVRIDNTDDCPDTFSHLSHKLKASPLRALEALARLLPYKKEVELAQHTCNTLLHEVEAKNSRRDNEKLMGGILKSVAAISKNYSVEKKLPLSVFLANSSVVRQACRPGRFAASQGYFIHCNRGTNGIEGCTSTAAGFSMMVSHKVILLTGDLSFFYDANALWNRGLKGNLRIIVFNDGKGGIFYGLPGLTASPALPDYVAAAHNSNAAGIAQSYNCTYLSLSSEEGMDDALNKWFYAPDNRPVILEVFI